MMRKYCAGLAWKQAAEQARATIDTRMSYMSKRHRTLQIRLDFYGCVPMYVADVMGVIGDQIGASAAARILLKIGLLQCWGASS